MLSVRIRVYKGDIRVYKGNIRVYKGKLNAKILNFQKSGFLDRKKMFTIFGKLQKGKL